MIRKIPQIGAKISLADFFAGYKNVLLRNQNEFIRSLSNYLNIEHVYLTNSGTAAFYIILHILKKISNRKEVILPAYTAPAMLFPVLECGLQPVLCDISLDDFNIDLKALEGLINNNTLCAVPTHLFGLPVVGIDDLRKKFSRVFFIEDCAQSWGSKIGEKNTGNFSSIGFSSFNRGKNLPTMGGGCIFTDSPDLNKKIKIEIDKLDKQNLFSRLSIPFKMFLFVMATNSFVYGWFYSLAKSFKDNQVPDGFSLKKYSNFQAGVGQSLLKKIDKSSEQRYQSGLALINGLAGLSGIIVPKIKPNCKPVFNRLPILFKNFLIRERIEKTLWQAGIDTARMYQKPLHHVFDLGYSPQHFPKACFFAQRMISLPTHPLIGPKEIGRIIEIIKENVT